MLIIPHWKIILEILVLWYVIYMTLVLIKGTRTEQLLKGLLILGLIFVLTQQLKLEAINWVMARIFPISVIALLVIFQPELRRGLTRLGQFGIYEEDSEVIDQIVKGAVSLSKKNIGGIIAIEREIGLKTYIESGIPLDGKVTAELINSIFLTQSPLHDGAVIVHRDRVVAAGCLLPLTQELKGFSKALGTRHRAAIGLSEETDAICIVVSEETGTISVAIAGRLTRGLDEENLEKLLKGIFNRPKRARRMHLKILSKIPPRPS